MSDFKKIETQEEFDKLIADRIQRERKSIEEKYQDYETIKKENDTNKSKIDELTKQISESTNKFAENEKMINELNSKVKAYETDSAKTRIALETGLPYQMASRLSGDTEEDIRKDAESLKAMMGNPSVPPEANPYENVPSEKTEKRDALKGVLKDLQRTN